MVLYGSIWFYMVLYGTILYDLEFKWLRIRHSCHHRTKSFSNHNLKNAFFVHRAKVCVFFSISMHSIFHHISNIPILFDYKLGRLCTSDDTTSIINIVLLLYKRCVLRVVVIFWFFMH